MRPSLSARLASGVGTVFGSATDLLSRREWKLVALCVALPVALLPFGLLTEIALAVAALWAFFAVLPMVTVVVLAMLLRRSPAGAGLRRAFGGLVFVLTVPYVAYFLLWTAMLATPMLVPAYLALAAAMRA